MEKQASENPWDLEIKELETLNNQIISKINQLGTSLKKQSKNKEPLVNSKNISDMSTIHKLVTDLHAKVASLDKLKKYQIPIGLLE